MLERGMYEGYEKGKAPPWIKDIDFGYYGLPNPNYDPNAQQPPTAQPPTIINPLWNPQGLHPNDPYKGQHHIPNPLYEGPPPAPEQRFGFEGVSGMLGGANQPIGDYGQFPAPNYSSPAPNAPIPAPNYSSPAPNYSLNYNPSYGLLSGEDAVSRGLGQAYGLMSSYRPSPYPSFVPSQGWAPSQQDYMAYTPNQPMAQIQTPNYQLNMETPAWQQFQPQQGAQYQNVNTQVQAQPWNYQGVNPNAQAAGYNWQDTTLAGRDVTDPFAAYGGVDPEYQKLGTTPTYAGLMGGDYEALQKALTTPGELAAGTAYGQGQTNLINQMGGRGLYGSSIMSNQARDALERPYMETLSTNAANAAAQRYGMQAVDLQNQNLFGLNVYGQQMGEQQAANQQAFNTWGTRLGETQIGQQMGLQAQQANQNVYANLQGLLSQQGLAQNAAGLSQAQLQTGVNQQNVANQLAQFQQANVLGQNQAQFQTNTQADNAARALQEAQAMNALRSGDVQQMQGLMANQNLAQNQFGQNIYNQQMAQQQAMNAYNLDRSQLGMQQNQNVYQAGVSDAARQQDYRLAQQTYANQGTEQQRQWANQQALEQMQYQLASGQYTNEQQTAMINQYLALAGRGQTTAGQNLAATTAQQQADAAQQQSLYGNIAGLLTTGGLLYGGSQGWF